MRLDAEYYQPHYLDMVKRFGEFKSLADYNPFILHPTEVKRVYEEDGLQLLFTQNIRDNRLDFSHVAFLPYSIEGQIQRNKLQPGDVVVTRTGANFGDAAPYDGIPSPIYASAHCIVIRCKGIPGAYLSTYFNTDTGKALLKRGVYGAAQPEISTEYIRTLQIPRFGESLEKRIEQILKQAKKMRDISEQLYTDAENLLVAELGLKKIELPREDITTLRISDVLKVGRIDAEYFHPQKAYTKEWLSKFSGNIVRDYFEPVREMYTPPTQDTGNSILNFDLTHALHYFLDDDGDVVPENEIGSLKKRIKKNDIVVSRLRSYLKEIAIVEVPEGVPAVGSSEFIILRSASKELLPEALLVYLRSAPVQTILKWSQDGSNHPRFQENELLAINVPDKVLKIQADIRKMIQEGIKAHREAKRLLGEAKSEVERLIEGK